MAAKTKPLTEEEIQAKVAEEARQAIAYLGGSIADQRSMALQYYFREPVGDLAILDENRSKVISTDVADTIEWILPSLLRIFTAGDDIVRFEPQGPEDEQVAKQATEYCNWIISRDNNGFVVFYTLFKDALLQKNGVGKVWWEVKETNETRTVYDLDDDTFSLLEGDPDIEIIEHTEHTDDQAIQGADLPSAAAPGVSPSLAAPGAVPVQPAMPQPSPDTQDPQSLQTAPQPTNQTLHDVTYRKTTEKGRVCIENVAPENFLIAKDAKTIADCAFCGQREQLSISDLVAMGYDYDQVSQMPSDSTADYNEEANARRETDQTDQTPVDRTGVMREIWVTEAYIRMDADGDGIAELRKIVCAGPAFEILRKDGKPDNEQWEGAPPFFSVTPIIQPHKFIGVAMADLVMSYQNIKTALLRGTLDNLYLTNTPGYFVSDSVDLDDLMDRRPGRIARLLNGAKPGDGHVQPDTIPFTAASTFQMLEELEGMKENATGVTRYNQGIDANSLNKTATGINQIMSASQQRVELIARIFAETGIKDLFKLILHCVTKYQDKPRMVRLRDQWVPMDPNEWDTQFDMSINVGLGTGNKDQMLGHLMTLLQIQTQAVQMQQGIHGPLVTGENLYNTVAKLVENAGLKSPELYFTDPKNTPPQPPQPPQPDPEMVKVQQQGEIDKQKLQLDVEKTKAQLALEQAKAQAEFGLKQQSADQAHQLKMASAMQQPAPAAPVNHVVLDGQGNMMSLTEEIKPIAAALQQLAENQMQQQQMMMQLAQVLQAVGQEISKPRVKQVQVSRGADNRIEGATVVDQTVQ